MAGFSSATLERIRVASDIVDIIGAYLPLKKAGANFVALCPFHKEKTPSFNVNPHKQIFHCFGCHKGGDVFTFVKEYENIGFVDAVRRLAERSKIPLDYEDNPAAQESRHLKDQLLEIHEKIAQRWQNCLLNEAAGETARAYLAKRGVSADAIQMFRLGAAPDSWDDTVNWAKNKGYDLPLVEKAGLILRKEESDHFYDRFRGRLLFPIGDEQGRVVGFSGRVLSGDEKTAKYVNSPETPIFTKSKIFFGLDKSKRAILDAGFAIICEGQLDLIACFTAGVQNIVAPQGTAFTDQHARILKRYAEEVVLCFDSDEAGQNAAVRSLDHLLASGLAVRVAVVPSPHDPDSYIKEFGGERFRELIEKAEGFFDYYLNRLGRLNDANTDRGRIAILRAMAEAVHKTGSAVLNDKYAQKTALRLGVSTEAVRAEFKKVSPVRMPAAEEEPESFDQAAPTELPRPGLAEFHLLKLMFLHDALVASMVDCFDLRWVAHPVVRQLVERRLAAQREQRWISLAAYLDELPSPEMRSLVTEAVAEERPIPNPEKQLADVAMKLRNQFIDQQMAALVQKLSQPGMGDAEKLELLREQQKLRAEKRAPLAPRQ
ncbi:MAG TPA: DNA primase [Verrucomicrobiae bacterium]|nr:DNA primase [Verrucomicrobiae bacterium]